MEKNKRFKFNRMSLAVYAICFFMLLLMHAINRIDMYPYDSSTYWELGYMFGVDDFSFSNFYSDVRGYFFPFVHYILIKLAFLGIGTEQVNLWVFHSLLYTLTFVKLFPGLLEEIFGFKISYKIRISFTIFCMYFFKGLILYPLSDLPALTCVIAALYMFFLLINSEKYSMRHVFIAIAMGAFCAAAYYMRPVYLIVVVGIAAGVLYYILRKKKIVLLFAIIGVVVLAIPQMIINHANLGTYNPLVITGSSSDSLFLQQLNWGVSVQKYETTLDVENYGSPSVYFKDSIGEKLVTESGGVDSYASYIKFVIKHFADMGCIYLKHLFNGLDVVYNNCYILDITKSRFGTQFLNYSLIFLSFCGIKKYFKNKKWNSVQVIFSIVYLLPVLLVIPTAVETRFFVALHFVLYIFAAMVIFDAEWRKAVFDAKYKYLIKYLAFLMICFVLNSQTFSTVGIPLW